MWRVCLWSWKCFIIVAIVFSVLIFAPIYFPSFRNLSSSNRGSTSRQYDQHYTDHYNTMSDERENKTFVYYVGKDSIANDILLVKKTIPELKEACRATHNCVGFNSDGYLKNKILPYNKWSNNTNNGLYILDKDYCAMGWHSCSDDTICVNQYNGKYICNNKIPMDEDTIHIVMSVDIHLLEGIVPLIISIQQHNPINEIIIHIVVGEENRSLIKSTINCSIQTQENVQILFVNFEVPDDFQQLINVIQHPYLASTANFARFFFDKIFSSLTHVLYLDVDTIVLHDMKSLWKQLITNEHLLLIVPRDNPTYGEHFTDHKRLTELYHKRYNQTIDMSSYSFNTGVLGFNLGKWRRDNITREVIYWMKEHFKNPLWFQGTQPVLYIFGFNNWKTVDKRWNINGLGTRAHVPLNAVKSAYILHWNGINKLWGNAGQNESNLAVPLESPKYAYIWKKYQEKKCNNNGICQKENNEGYSTCKCNNGYEGRLCEKHVNS